MILRHLNIERFFYNCCNISRNGLLLLLAVISTFLMTEYGYAKENPKSFIKKVETEKSVETEVSSPVANEALSEVEIEHRNAKAEYELNLQGFDETSVVADIQWLGGKEINTLVRENMAYLSVTDLFDFLKIRNQPSKGMDSITGFFIEPNALYLIDKAQNEIRYKGKVWHLASEDLIRTPTQLYLRSDYFSLVYGLECDFDSYNLTVKLNISQEVPAVFEKKQEEVHKNLNQLKGIIVVDTNIARTYPLFHFGSADWQLFSTQQEKLTDMRAYLGLGGVVLGGELSLGLNYNTSGSFNEKQQSYLWHYANNDNKLVRQVMLGKIAFSPIASVYAPIVGAQVTNRSTTFRRSFGSYNISDVISPNWIVELYVNNVLVDFTRADASGFYSLDVPLAYGGLDVKLRFYGPNGEIQQKEKHLNIPINFLPKHEIEYTTGSGLIEDGTKSIFSHSAVNYGVTNGLTVGWGLEYLSSLKSGNYIPFVTTSVKVLSNLYFSGEYSYGVRGKALLSYRLPSNMQFELNYTKYTKGQTAIIFNYDEEAKASAVLPIRFNKFSGLTRFSIAQIVLPNATKEWMGEWMITANVGRVNVNLTTYGNAMKQDGIRNGGNLQTNLSLASRLRYGITVTPSVQYDFLRSQFTLLKLTAEKMVARNGYLSAGCEHQVITNSLSATLGFRYDFSFVKVSATANSFNGVGQFTESATGSIVYDKKSKLLKGGNRNSVGRAGISVLPFVDINGDGHYNAGEPKVDGVQLTMNSGSISYSTADTIFHVSDLEPYASVILQINTDGVDHISWQTKNKTMRVVPNPNNFTMIEVPFAVVGEVSGTVSISEAGGKKPKGIGQITVNIYNKDSVLIAHTMSESDGFFSYTGLRPGSYFVSVDTAQLGRIDYTSINGCIPVTIGRSIEGDLVDGIQFVLRQNNNRDQHEFVLKKVQVVEDEPTKANENNFAILVDVTADLNSAGKIKTKLNRILSNSVKIVMRHEDYLVEMVGFQTLDEVQHLLGVLAKHGYPDALVIKAGK